MDKMEIDEGAVALFKEHHVEVLAKSLARWTEAQLARVANMKKSASKSEVKHEKQIAIQMILDFYPYRSVLSERYSVVDFASRLREICSKPSLEQALVEAGLKEGKNRE